MIFMKIRQLIRTKISFNTNAYHYLKISPHYTPRRYVWFNVLLYTVNKSENLMGMSKTLKLKHILREFNVTRLWNLWIRKQTLSSMVKRYRRDKGVREVFECVKQTLFRSRRTLLLSATAACKSNRDHEDVDVPCRKNITDEDLEALITDLDDIEELSRITLYCINCGRRSAIDKKNSGAGYCTCKRPNVESYSHDGWVPFMEAEEVIIWRKEYKSGQNYAYKVYGRYPELHAKDFAAVQIDGSYRKAWDAAVAFLKVIQHEANGVKDQSILHWEVMWPRMFSNRDYVFIRRHKQFKIPTKFLKHKDSLFQNPEVQEIPPERPTIHSKSKRLSVEAIDRDTHRDEERDGNSKVFVIISRSCVHDEVPELKNAVRVKEYWSHMVVRSLGSGDKPGMEFVLTYYDDAGSGGLPGGVAAWATGRAAPAYLARMRRATNDYCSSGPTLNFDEDSSAPQEATQDKSTQTESAAEIITQLLVTTIENITKKEPEADDVDTKVVLLDNSPEKTEKVEPGGKDDGVCELREKVVDENVEKIIGDDVKVEIVEISNSNATSEDIPESENEEEIDSSWWQYMYPFYYFL